MTVPFSKYYDAVRAIERLGNQGMIVSVCFGPCGDKGNLWSVNVMNPATLEEFKKPFAASCFEDIKKILDNEMIGPRVEI
jgi:hypothetical protein